MRKITIAFAFAALSLFALPEDSQACGRRRGCAQETCAQPVHCAQPAPCTVAAAPCHQTTSCCQQSSCGRERRGLFGRRGCCNKGNVASCNDPCAGTTIVIVQPAAKAEPIAPPKKAN